MAYITNRPEEERQSLLGGQGAIAGGAGGQGMSGAPAPQAGVSKGTGGSQPWVNIQSYLNANRNDQSGIKSLQKDFGDPLEKSKGEALSELGNATSAINQQKGLAENALGNVAQNLDAAKTAYKQSILNFSPNIYGGATQRALDESTKSFQAPEFNPKYLDASLESKFAQLKDPYGYLSSQYANQGLTSGQRALQEQLTRKSGGFPQLANALSGNYQAAKSNIENENAAVAKDIQSTDESYRQKFAAANKAAKDYAANQGALSQMLGAGNEDKWASMLGVPAFLGNRFKGQDLGTIGKNIDQYLKTWGPDTKEYNTYQSMRGQYNDLIGKLLSKYGFQ